MYYLLQPLVSIILRLIENPLLFFAALFPVAVIVVVVYMLDRNGKEPLGLLFKALWFGVVSTIAAGMFNAIGSLLFQIISDSTFLFYLEVGICEEFCKYFATKKGLYGTYETDNTFDCIIYCVYASMGFAFFENLDYVFAYGFGTAILRACLSVPAHASFGVVMGVLYHREQWDDGLSKRSILTVVVPGIMHFVYDYLAMTNEDLFYPYAIIMILVCIIILVFHSFRDDAFYQIPNG